MYVCMYAPSMIARKGCRANAQIQSYKLSMPFSPSNISSAKSSVSSFSLMFKNKV